MSASGSNYYPPETVAKALLKSSANRQALLDKIAGTFLALLPDQITVSYLETNLIAKLKPKADPGKIDSILLEIPGARYSIKIKRGKLKSTAGYLDNNKLTHTEELEENEFLESFLKTIKSASKQSKIYGTIYEVFEALANLG